MLFALETPQIVLMTIGFTGMLVFAGIAVWLLKRQREAERPAQPPAKPTPRPVAPVAAVSTSTPAPAPAPAAHAPVTDAVAFEPTMFAPAAVSEEDAPSALGDPTQFVGPETVDKTEFIPTGGQPAERTEFIPAPFDRGR